ncbi:MAG TPA: IclR family transcriptional regulator [Solirubrobacteraceae bacterium]|nr:IclR family transcriptional regulator [Solirubrobacteraceae bacterium]
MSEQATAAAAPAKPTYPIASVDSALRLLLLLSERGQLRIAEASREIDVARSTAHRLLAMLAYYGFAQQDAVSKLYTPGPELIKAGLQAVRALEPRAVARPFIEALVAELGETVHLSGAIGDLLTCFDSVESTRAVRVGGRIGVVFPWYASAAGRALLAQMPLERVRALVAGELGMRVSTELPLEQELAATRERGYAIQYGEFEPEVSSVAAAIGGRGSASYAICVAVPTTRVGESDIPRLGRAARECADAVAVALASRAALSAVGPRG